VDLEEFRKPRIAVIKINIMEAVPPVARYGRAPF